MLTPLFPYPAALVETPKSRIMAIADLHIGWEMALSQKGIHVPTQTPKLLSRLAALISRHKPQTLAIVGDVKHTVATAEPGEWHEVPSFFDDLVKRVSKVLVIPGNHDGNLKPLIPERVQVSPAASIVFGDVGFFHGHKWPSPAILECKTLVMGHVHPVVSFRDPTGLRITRQVWVKIPCDRHKLARTLLHKNRSAIERKQEGTLRKCYGSKSGVKNLFIMPSFNEFLGGRPLNERQRCKRGTVLVGPVLRSEAVEIENAEAYLLDGTLLGTLDQLKNHSGDHWT